MFTPPPFVFRASPEKLRDYSEHQAATCARRDSICPREKIVALCVLTTRFPLRRPLPGCFLWSEQPHPGTFLRRCPSPLCLPSARQLLIASRRSLFSQDTLNNLILRSPQDWQTTAALPFKRIEGVSVEWDECVAAGRRPVLPPLPPPPLTRARLALAGCTSTSACCSACHVRFCRLPALRACGRRDSGSPSPILLADEGVSRMRAFCSP